MIINQLHKVITNWQSFLSENTQKIETMIFIGYQSAGKSTFCQLVKAYVGNDKDQKLTFQDGKVKSFSLPGVISANTLKIQTIKPRLYTFQNTKVKEQKITEFLLEIPSFIIPPFIQSNKKWTILDSMVSFNYLTQNISKAVFVLILQQKYTRAKMQGLKNILETFLNYFVDYPKELFEATAIIISKSPSTTKKDAIYTRLETCIKKMDEKLNVIGVQWFQNIKKRQAVIIQYKFTTQQAAKEDTTAIYSELTKINKYKFKQDKSQIKTLCRLPQQTSVNLQEYFSGTVLYFLNLLEIMQKLLDGQICGSQQLTAEKNRLIYNTDGETKDETFNNSMNKIAQNSFSKEEQETVIIPTLFDILVLYKKLEDLQIYMDQQNQSKPKIYLNILDYFIQSRIIQADQQITYKFKDRGLLFQRFTKNIKQQNFPWTPESLVDQLKNKVAPQKNKYSQLLQKMNNIMEIGQNIEYYRKAQLAIQFLCDDKMLKNDKVAQNLMIKAKLQIAGLQQPNKSLKALLDLEKFLSKIGNEEMLGSLYQKIGEILIKLNHIDFALELFGRCTNPYRVIEIMTSILTNRQECRKRQLNKYIPYLKFLQSAGLIQKSYETCYLLGNYFQQTLQRKLLQQFLTVTPSQPKPHIIKAFVQKLSEAISDQERQAINKIAQNAIQI